MKLDNEWWRARYRTAKDVKAYLLSHSLDLDPVRTTFEVDTYLSAIKEKMSVTHQMAILDGYCGNGRHALELARRGFENILAYDFSKPMIDLVRKQTKNEDLTGIKAKKMDARNPKVKSASIDYYQTQNTSFLGFFTPEGNQQVLRSAYRVLRRGGILAFDLVDKEYALNQLAQAETEQIQDGYTIQTLRNTQVTSQGTFTQFSENFYLDGSLQVEMTKTIRIQVFSAEEVADLLQPNGFGEISIYERVFNYDPSGKILGTRGVRNLFVARKT